MLAELGFALNLESCAATGATENLDFVSPRSGRAVSAAAGAPYRERLLRCPSFLTPGDSETVTWSAIADGLALTGYFLQRQVLLPLGKREPAARTRFVDRISREATRSGVILPDD